MARGWLVLCVLAGCDAHLAPPLDGAPDARGEALAAVPVLSTTPWTAGGAVTVTVDGVAPGEVVYVVGSRTTGALPCPGAAGGLCLDLASGYRLLGTPVADGAGVATLDLTAPNTVGRTVVLQAVVVRGVGGVGSLKTDVVEVVVSAVLDADGDGHEVDVDCDDTDPAVHPGAAEVCDGVDDDCDPSTVETGLVTSSGVGYPTLADALVHTAPGGVIELCDGVYPGVLTLSEAVTIRGRGAGVTIIDGGGLGTVLTIEEAAVLEDLTVTGGYTNTDGGGLYVTGPSLVLRGVDVVANHAGSEGGGLHARYTDVEVEDTLFTENDANVAGGAIYLYNAHGLTGTRASIVGNSARADAGGVSLWASSFACTDCELAANTAARGAGIYLGSGSSSGVFDGGAVVENVAATAGGGVYVSGGTVTTTDTDFGLGASENTPDDLAGSGGFSVGWYGAGSSVSCDPAGC